MHTKAFIHKMLQGSKHQEGGYDIKTIVFQSLPWDTFEECRAIMNDGATFAALFQDGEFITPFVELPRENK